MADWGELPKVPQNQHDTGKVPSVTGPYPSMGYVTGFQLPDDDLTNENPAATAIANGANLKIEAAKLHLTYRPNLSRKATTFFWDRTSNSVQPMSVLGVSA